MTAVRKAGKAAGVPMKWDNAALDKLLDEMQNRLRLNSYETPDAELIGYWMYRLEGCKSGAKK